MQLKTHDDYTGKTANEKESSPVCMLILLEKGFRCDVD